VKPLLVPPKEIKVEKKETKSEKKEVAPEPKKKGNENKMTRQDPNAPLRPDSFAAKDVAFARRPANAKPRAAASFAAPAPNR
jgi:hypothetical protein